MEELHEVVRDLDEDFFPLTDYGNAERLVALEGDDLMYVPGPGWFAYTGKRWKLDDDGRVTRRAKRAARKTYEIGRRLAESAPDDPHAVEHGHALMAWARRSESASSLRATVTLAQTELQVAAAMEELDADPFLLNVGNGTIDLRTGDLLAPSREHRITKWSKAVYDPGARDPHWERVLEHVDRGYDGTLKGYLRLWAGYSATGSVQEDLAHLIDGPGGTGKSTVAEAVRKALGEYGAVAPFDMFVQRRGDQAHPTDLARLAGIRIVTSEEGPKNRTLDAAKIKNLTGGTAIPARFMRGDFFEYEPVLKLWLVSNFRPRVHAEDTGAWRRLRAIPFTNVLPDAERDERLRNYLKTDQRRVPADWPYPTPSIPEIREALQDGRAREALRGRAVLMAWPITPPAWLLPWVIWRFRGSVAAPRAASRARLVARQVIREIRDPSGESARGRGNCQRRRGRCRGLASPLLTI